MSPLPEYVEYGSQVSAPPPVLCRGGRFLALVLQAGREQTEDLCRRMLNVPAERAVEYRVLVPYVLMLTGTFDEVSSGARGFEDWGFVREAHVSVWVPLAAGRPDGGGFTLQRACLAVPFIWVDNPLSYAGGREDYGYPKAMARFSPDTALGDHVAVQAFGGEHGRDRRAEWVPLLELDRVAAEGAGQDEESAPDGPAPTWRGPDEVVAGIQALTGEDAAEDLAGGITIPGLVRAVMEKGAPQVFLKQFRDAHDAGEACYRRIVEVPFQATDVAVRPLLYRWHVTVHQLQSHPLASELGLGDQTTRWTFGVSMNLTIDPGSVVAPPVSP